MAFMWKSSGVKRRGQKAEKGNLERCGKISYLLYACVEDNMFPKGFSFKGLVFRVALLGGAFRRWCLTEGL